MKYEYSTSIRLAELGVGRFYTIERAKLKILQALKARPDLDAEKIFNRFDSTNIVLPEKESMLKKIEAIPSEIDKTMKILGYSLEERKFIKKTGTEIIDYSFEINNTKMIVKGKLILSHNHMSFNN